MKSILRQHNATVPLASRTEELVETLIQRIDNGESPSEILLATEILGLAFINHSDGFSHSDQELLYQDASRALRHKAKKTKSNKIKAQCYETLALLTYLISSQIDAQMIRHEMYNIIAANGEVEEEISGHVDQDDDQDEDNDTLMTAVTHAYGLMFIISFCQGPVNPDIIQEEMDKMLGELELLMDFPGKLQSAAGQTVALMFETLQILTDQGEDQEQNELNELIHTLRTLSMDQDDDEYIFQDILNTVEDGGQPYHEVDINGKSFILDRWYYTVVCIPKMFR
ncbi:uncharacterized protein BX664DRAFT_150981 [Halteromyces radiatus]|uniref:uncharacterized protein n=1 Tax=Halteromyces radiatus TaxID=101107 RepID=UPI002221216D|nr:uncharacterized protein BX664DRAFT_150981 [Halteromyces radiatus]KAI8086118.1 hypothetical protein BX664DRAFT_150981 [Halteromyces radiatus]